MEVLIDDREKDDERIDAIIKYYGKAVRIERLDTGDIVINQDDNPSIAFEIKTWQDFIGSIKNRRIQKEVLSMKEQYPFSFVIVYCFEVLALPNFR